jgi:hypothetical protein
VHLEGGPVGQVDAAVGEVGVGRVFGLDEDAEADEGDEAYAGGQGGLVGGLVGWGRGKEGGLQETDCENADYDELLAAGEFEREDEGDGEDEDYEVGYDD